MSSYALVNFPHRHFDVTLPEQICPIMKSLTEKGIVADWTQLTYGEMILHYFPDARAKYLRMAVELLTQKAKNK